MKTADIEFSNLCDKIDFWKREAEYYKEKYEEEVRISVRSSNERLKEAQDGVATALMFALSVRDTEDGRLIISPENRKMLSNRYKSSKP